MPIQDYSRRTQMKNKRIINLNIFNKLLMLLMVFGAVYYVIGVNDLVVKGFELQALKKSYSSLENQNRDYNTYATSLKSYNNLEQRIQRLDMVQADKIDYLKSKKGSVAVR